MVYLNFQKNRQSIVAQRKGFARQLTALVDSGQPVIFLDETSFNSWAHYSKVWQSVLRPVEVVINPKRAAITVYGAIGHGLQSPVFTTGVSTNTQDFLKFLQLIVDNLKPHS